MINLYLKCSRLTYSTCVQFTKSKGKIKKETGNLRYISQNELDKVCFVDYLAYGD